MARGGSLLSINILTLPIPLARSADAPPLTGHRRVGISKLMPIFAVGGRSPLIPVCLPSEGKAGEIPKSRRGNNVRKYHSFFGTFFNSVWLQFVFFGEFGKQVFNSANRNEHRVPAVPHVFFVRRPTTIFRRIWPVIVNPVYLLAGMAGWHINDKIVESGKPPLANNDAASAIIMELFNIRIIASLFHAVVYAIKRMQVLVSHIGYSFVQQKVYPQ